MANTQRSIETKLLRRFAGKSLRGWPNRKQQSERLRKYRDLNRAKYVPSEKMAQVVLKNRSKHKWTPQVVWGNRIFDFWCHALRAAIEIDGAGHHRRFDLAQDRWHVRRSGIITFRVPAGDYRKLRKVIRVTNRLEDWRKRRERLVETARRKLTDPRR